MDRKTGSHLQPTVTQDPLQTVNRRKVLGLAAAGVAGGYVFSEAAFPLPALAATTTEQGALAPAVVNLTDAPTIAVDASLGNDFRVTIAASRAMGNPTNPADGQKIVFQITQGAAGSSTITWGSAFQFSSGLPQPTLSTTAGQTDLLGFIYNAAKGTWLLVAFVNGFSPIIFPTVSGVSPNTGPLKGGTAITITGTGFVNGATVVIGQGSGAGSGAIAATNVVVVSPTEITAVTGAGTKAGTYNLFVITSGGTSVANSGDKFTYH
jgi:IPT/TIG domain